MLGESHRFRKIPKNKITAKENPDQRNLVNFIKKRGNTAQNQINITANSPQSTSMMLLTAYVTV